MCTFFILFERKLSKYLVIIYKTHIFAALKQIID